MVVPELLTAAATDLTAIGVTLQAAHREAASTLALAPAAADEVSVNIASLFSRQAEDYQQLASEAAAFHEQFVERLAAGAGAYASAEALNVSLLQPFAEALGTAGAAVAQAVPQSLDELGSLLFTSLLSSFILILLIFLGIPAVLFVGVPLLLFLAAFLYFNPNLVRGFAALANGRG
ncbi:PE family protein [Mycobacterium bourgelatii]|nr:PE family protein [Mycobacterium bourgelatii]